MPGLAIWTLGAIVLFSWSCGPTKVTPPVPHARGKWIDTLPPVPQSYMDVPVRYDLRPALQWLESAVPSEFGDIRQRQPVPGKRGLLYAFAIKRSPFQIGLQGRTASLQADVAYQGRVWYDPPLLPEISASCGTEGPAPRARLTIATTIQLEHDWSLAPRTRASAQPLSRSSRDRCTVADLDNVDVTDQLLAAAQGAIQEKLAEFDARLQAFDLPSEARRVWDVLCSPIKLTDSVWALINPSAIRIGQFEMRQDTLLTRVALSANPRVVTGRKPPPSRYPLPSPDDSARGKPGLHFLTEGRMPYDAGSSVLTRELRGTVIRVKGHKLHLDSLRLLGVGDGRLAVGVAVSGPVKGMLYVVGHAAYDTSTAELYMPDLELDVGTRGVLSGALAWLKESDLERLLRSRARIKLGPLLAQGRDLLEKNLNRDLAEGVHLSSKIRTVRMLGLAATPAALLARGLASGEGDLTIRIDPRRLAGGKRLAAKQRPLDSEQ
jgi:uncharacterized protein DUF4403